MLTFMLLPSVYLLFALSPIRANGFVWATHYVPFYAMTLLVTWLQSGGFKVSAIVASIGAAPIHMRALWATLRKKPARWSATNQHGAGTRSLWVVMPHVALLTLNVTAIVVGLIVMADPPPTWLSVSWAVMIVLILGRMIIESVLGDRAGDHAPGARQTPTPTPGAVTRRDQANGSPIGPRSLAGLH
jgi:cellulose synthase (UDP-forming)